jgi:hypothetical protein
MSNTHLRDRHGLVLRPATPGRGRSGGPAPTHWGPLLVLVAAAFPMQLPHSVPLIGYPSLLDVAMLGALWSLFASLAFRGRIVLPYHPLLVLVAIPVYVTALSMLWSRDLAATMQTTLSSAFAMVAYVYVLSEMGRMSAARIYRYIRWFSYLLLVPAVLMLLHVPGFAPQESGLEETSAEYVGYFSRLSHPFIGRSNNLATVLAFFVPILAHRTLVARTRADGVAAATVITAVVLTQSRGVLLALLITVPLLLVSSPDLRHRGERTLRAVGKTALFAAAVLGLLFWVNPATSEFFATRFTTTGVDERTQLFDAAVDLVATQPVTGYGGGISPIEDNGVSGERAHNTYLQQAISFGVPLGVLVSSSLVAIVPFLFTRRTRAGVVVGYAVLGQLVIFATESSYEGNVLRVLFSLSLGLGVALVHAEAEEHGVDRPSTRATFGRRVRHRDGDREVIDVRRIETGHA